MPNLGETIVLKYCFSFRVSLQTGDEREDELPVIRPATNVPNNQQEEAKKKEIPFFQRLPVIRPATNLDNKRSRSISSNRDKTVFSINTKF